MEPSLRPPLWHRGLEAASIVLLLGLVALILGEVFLAAPGRLAASAVLALFLVPLPAYVLADFVSGFVHFLGHRFGDETTPVFGPTYVRPFREHHVDPKAITRHDFIETNGLNSVVSIPVAALAYGLLPLSESTWGAFAGAFVGSFLLSIFATNQIHKWAHQERPPRLVRRLQSWGVILSPENHEVHHTSPHDTYYCITAGWLNPLLERVRFFERAEHAIRRAQRSASRLTLVDRDAAWAGSRCRRAIRGVV